MSEKDQAGFSVFFTGEKTLKVVDELAQLWDKNRHGVIDLALGLLYKVSQRKRDCGETLLLMNADGVLTIVDIS